MPKNSLFFYPLKNQHYINFPLLSTVWFLTNWKKWQKKNSNLSSILYISFAYCTFISKVPSFEALEKKKVIKNDSGRNKGNLAHFQTPSPKKNEKNFPEKMSYIFSKHFFLILQNECWPSVKYKKNSYTPGWLPINRRGWLLLLI